MEQFKAIDKSKIAGKIAGIARSGKTLQQNVHNVAVSIIHHANEHGDYSKMSDLYKALPGAVRKADFVAWVLAFTPLNWDKDNKKFKKVKSQERIWDVDGAWSNPFWVFTQDKDEQTQPLDVRKLLLSIRSRVAKAEKEGREVEHKELLNLFKTVEE